MKIGLTGSSGTLGSYLTKNLKNVVKFNDKIENKKKVENWIKKNNFEVVIHLAAIVPILKVKKNKSKALKINLDGTKNIVNGINKYSKKKVWLFYSSTSHVYSFSNKIKYETKKTKPLNYYGKTKKLAENYILNNQRQIIPCVGRIFSYTSLNQNKDFVIPSLILKLKSKKKNIYFKNLNHNRDFISIDDILKAIKKLMKFKKRGIFNICSGKKVNLKDILITLNKKYKKKIYIKDNKIKTTLFGSNYKLNSLGWKPSFDNYLKYIEKTYK